MFETSFKRNLFYGVIAIITFLLTFITVLIFKSLTLYEIGLFLHLLLSVVSLYLLFKMAKEVDSHTAEGQVAALLRNLNIRVKKKGTR